MTDNELEEIRRKKKMELIERMSGESGASSPDKPIDLTDATMEDAVKKYPTLVVDCWAAWCGPCKMIAPVVEQLAAKLAGKMVFGKLNVDENQQTSSKYQIMSIPALLVFKDGKHVDTLIGYMPAPALEQRLSKYL
jgi:thioredoxin 1